MPMNPMSKFRLTMGKLTDGRDATKAGSCFRRPKNRSGRDLYRGGSQSRKVRCLGTPASSQGEHGVAISHGVTGTDGEGQTVVAQSRQMVDLFFAQNSVGSDQTDGGVGHGWSFIATVNFKKDNHRIFESTLVRAPGSGH
jgi:hypothetical protein